MNQVEKDGMVAQPQAPWQTCGLTGQEFEMESCFTCRLGTVE